MCFKLNETDCVNDQLTNLLRAAQSRNISKLMWQVLRQWIPSGNPHTYRWESNTRFAANVTSNFNQLMCCSPVNVVMQQDALFHLHESVRVQCSLLLVSGRRMHNPCFPVSYKIIANRPNSTWMKFWWIIKIFFFVLIFIILS